MVNLWLPINTFRRDDAISLKFKVIPKVNLRVGEMGFMFCDL